MPVIDKPVQASSVQEWHLNCDVLIVGAGMAGTCAALEAYDKGADVLLVERASGGGGASATSEGIFYLGGGTDVQNACGYSDSVENMFKFMRASTSAPHEDVLKFYCENSPEHCAWLEKHGVTFERRAFDGKAVAMYTGEGLLYTGNEKSWPYRDSSPPAPRGHQASNSQEKHGGATAMEALQQSLQARQVRTLFDSRVRALITDEDGGVVGATIRSGSKLLYVRAAKGVVLAAGSFNLNQEMTGKYIPLLAEFGEPMGIPSNDGSGVLLGQSAGAKTLHMEGAISTAPIYPPEGLIRGIVVNKQGKRFVAEDVYHGKLGYMIQSQPDHIAYLIVDSTTFEYPQFPHQLIDGWESVDDMEAGLNIPTGSLQTTIEEYNQDAERGVDQQFHKSAEWITPLKEGPWAAFDLSVTSSRYMYISLGGLDIDIDARVLHSSGNPIEGLFAAGANCAHFSSNGGEYASGMSLGPASFFGRIAGAKAAGQ